ncbi:hypothetical protein GMRT_10957 [Giardia muris]|uniref:Uncharacterized protein n=1 Tax=Giardia muris TaxID=5742 RepID=A0A4Z1T0X9_GIAMU|nr:hypothetical protein GMRT_10957 [Giardia muris]|eukprot:TNJ29358.1 hypothetical protein GMRT_10957 [Giardia muris]
MHEVRQKQPIDASDTLHLRNARWIEQVLKSTSDASRRTQTPDSTVTDAIGTSYCSETVSLLLSTVDSLDNFEDFLGDPGNICAWLRGGSFCHSLGLQGLCRHGEPLLAVSELRIFLAQLDGYLLSKIIASDDSYSALLEKRSTLHRKVKSALSYTTACAQACHMSARIRIERIKQLLTVLEERHLGGRRVERVILP